MKTTRTTMYSVGDTVLIYGSAYRIVRDRKRKTDRPGMPGPYGGNYEIGVTIANDPEGDTTHWTIIS